ncbi:MAG: hypothetical protein AAGH88_09525 [Planctomycetota bacterium]
MPRIDPERSKRRIRRLSILGGTLILIIGLGTGLYAINRASGDTLAQQKVLESQAAFEQGDYAQVVALLENRETSTNTIRAITQDPELLYRYVQARRAVPLDNGEHIALLFPALRQVVALDPGNRKAGIELLKVQLIFGQDSHALTTSTRLIEVHPDDAELLQYRAAVYERMGRARDALNDVWAALAITPLDVRAGADVARLTLETNDDPARFVAWADGLAEQHPQDPRALVLQGHSRLLMNDETGAEQAFVNAAQAMPINQDFAQVLIQWLEVVNRFDLARQYLEQHAGPGVGDLLAEELFFRQYESGAYDAAVQRFEAGDMASARTDLIALAAICAKRSGQDELADRLLLHLHGNGPQAKHWAAVLDALWSSPIRTGELIAATQTALAGQPNNPHLLFILGDTLMGMGEPDAALVHLRTAARVRNAWAQPRYLIARIALGLGEYEQAAALAQGAQARQTNPVYADLEAAALALAADARDPSQVEQAAARIDQVHTQTPGASRSLVALVALYQRANDPIATQQTVIKALGISPPPDLATLAEVARIVEPSNPELASQVRDRAEALYGQNAQTALDRAITLAMAGKVDDAAAFLRQQTPEPAGLVWRQAMAEFLSFVRSPDAVAAWIELAELFPENFGVQRLAADKVPLGDHPAFAERVVKRMRETAGESSVGWRIARARLLLTGPQAETASAYREAGRLLLEALETAPNRADALRLISLVYEMSGDMDAAITSMLRANHAEPDLHAAQYRLGTMLYQQKRFREAQAPLLKVAGSERADLELRMNAMLMLGQQGELKVLIPIAKAMVGARIGGVQAQVLLTEFYLSDGQLSQAQQMAEQLLLEPAPESIAYLIEYFERTNQPDRAEGTLALLDNVEMADSQRSEIRGLFATRRNDMESALRHFRDAAEAAPDQPRRWRTLVAMDLIFNQPGLAIRDAERSRSLGINDPGIRAVLENSELLQTLAVDPRFNRLAAAVVSDDENRAAALRALSTIRQAAVQRTPLDTVAQQLAEQAIESPKFLPLQIATIQLMYQAQRYTDAAEFALQTMQRFPGDSESARLAAITLNASEDWRRSAIAADQWGKRAPEYRPYAAVILATAQRELTRYDDALETLAPYLDQARQDPGQHFGLISEYAWCLAYLGRIDPAWELIQPQLETGPRWRAIAGRIAAEALPRASHARDWLLITEQAVPADNLGERLVLAQACFDAAARLDDDALLAKSRELVEQVVQLADPPIEAWFLRGVITEASGDLQAAEESYRKLLQINPQTDLALNNLAMVLLTRGSKSAEAIRLAEQATRIRPEEANYFDTLAKACLANRQLDRAMRAIDRAIELDRFNGVWRLTQADILEAMGEFEQAKVLRERYQTER